jgi:starch synthase
MRVVVCTFAFSEVAVSQARALEEFCETILLLPAEQAWRAEGLCRVIPIRYSPQQSVVSKCRAILAAIAKLKELRPDVLHLQGGTPVLLPFVPLLRNFRVVLSLHDPSFHSGEENRIGAMTQRLMTTIAARVIVMSDAMKIQALRTYPRLRDKLAVIPLGIHDMYGTGPERCPPGLRANDKFILLFGRLSPYKGVEDLLDAFSLVSSRLEHKLVLAGRQLYRINIPPATSDRVVAINQYIDDNVLRYLFRHCEIVVLPYRDATQSGVLMTAYAFAKPVIVTRVGGLPEMVIDQQTGFVVPPRDPESLALCLQRALSDPSRLARMGTEGLAFANRNFSWRATAVRHMEVYTEVMSKAQAPK